MPEATRASVKTMGYVGWGVLREIAHGKGRYRFEGAAVIYEAGIPVGWGCLYSYRNRRVREVGFWVRKAHRKKGYGVRLIKYCHKKWNDQSPKAFDKARTMWDALTIVQKMNRCLSK